MTETDEFPYSSRDIPADIPSEPAPVPPPVPPRKRASSGPSDRKRSGRSRTVPTSTPPKTTDSGVGKYQAKRKEEYKEGINGLLQLGALAAFPVAPADAAAVSMHGESVSEAVADLALTDERVAALLDKILTAGPYGALLAAVIPLAAQIAVNHGLLKPGLAGTLAPRDLITEVTGVTPEGGENAGNESHNGTANHVHA